MDNKIKLFAVASVVAVMASGCSGYRTSNQNAPASGSGDYSSSGTVGTGGGSGQVSRGSQVSGSGQVSRDGLFGQRRPATTCAPCATNNTQAKSTYTYKPATKPAYQAPAKPAPKQAGQHSQQWYVDRWKREQAAGKQQPKTNTNYSGYGNTGSYTYDAASNNNTNYYDYSSAGKANTANTNVSTSNKSIYTGGYQQKTYKPYKPTTYSGGNAGTTNNTYSAPAPAAASSGNGSTYTVKKGDTVFEIMRQTGVYWKDIIKMNNLQAPAYNINPGQIIRLK